MNNKCINLVEPGFLKSCKYGKYHYLEPWIGCEHNCLYCYGRSHKTVNNSLTHYQTTFNNPLPQHNPDILLNKIRQAIHKNNVKVLKLCRYTDIFTPKFVKNGLTYAILNELCQLPIGKIIITTKGVPDKNILNLIKQHKNRFSYSAVIKPQCEYLLEINIPINEEKLMVMSELNKAGVKCTVGMHPLLFSINMELNEWRVFFKQIKSFGLSRVMFSYLMLDAGLIEHLKKSLSPKIFDIVMGYFDADKQFTSLMNLLTKN
ncbi:MAG: hypothetical protein PVG30_01355 [Gammaproteobacteria bacterium]|jgi:DNA repair photolyase